MTKLFDARWKLAVSGGIFGLFAVILALSGNPANMAICVACFIRDMAGAMHFHSAAAVSYFRPEIVGFVGGSCLIALATKEFKATAGSSPMIRFVLGVIMAIGALIFLGCPLRMVIRMAAGDFNAYVALVGFVGGVVTGSIFLKKGYSLGRAYETKTANGLAFPVLLALLFVVGLTTTLFAASTSGPGSMHAPVWIALVSALILGAIAQKSRMCFAGGIRDVVLAKNFDLLSILGGLFVVLLVFNLVNGSFHPGFANQPIAHSQHLWSVLGMYAVGFAAALAGGCPYRQLILAGQGSSDSAVTCLGLFFGAAAAHNFNLVGAAAKAATETEAAVPGGPSINGKVAVIVCIVVLFVIAFSNLRKSRQRRG